MRTDLRGAGCPPARQEPAHLRRRTAAARRAREPGAVWTPGRSLARPVGMGVGSDSIQRRAPPAAERTPMKSTVIAGAVALCVSVTGAGAAVAATASTAPPKHATVTAVQKIRFK